MNLEQSSIKYRYAEYAHNGANRRGRVQPLDEITSSTRESFTSVYRMSEDAKTYAENPETGNGTDSLRGYVGAVEPTRVHFDVDRDNPEDALKDARRLLDRIEGYGVDPDAVRIYYSGSKGFHVEIPGECFGGFEAFVDAPEKVKAIASEIAGDVSLDESVYERIRLWRDPNTVNGKSGLYKVALSYDELNSLTVDQIKELAQEPREVQYAEPQICPDLVALKNSTHSAKPYAPKDVPGDEKLDALAQKIVLNMPPVGSRHGFGRSLALWLVHHVKRRGARKVVHDAWNLDGVTDADTHDKLDAFIDSAAEKLIDGDVEVPKPGGESEVETLAPGLLAELDSLLHGTPRLIVASKKIADMAAQKFAHTDMGNADRFEHLHGEDYRYVPAWHKFVVWTGGRWEIDERNVMGKWAEHTVKMMGAEASQIDDKADSTAMLSFAKTSESQSRRDAMIRTLKNRRTAVPEDFDKDAWLFNCPNGTLDLRTGELREHRREDLITKLSPVAYQPDAFAPTFETRLREIMPSEALRRFVQRILGYSLNGTTEEHALPIFYGTGANMKSTLLNLILEVTGDYGMQAGDDLLMVKQNAHPTEKADLFGKRFVVNQETQEGRRMNESAVKQMTGGDRIRARRMREDLWEFNPTHTLFLATNHKPVIHGTDHGIWRRLKLVPFTVTIPEANQDKGLPRKLRAELPGVLTWLVRGHMEWFEHGLSEPQEVKDATGGYREEMDTLAVFLVECCVGGESVGKGVLYNAYQEWCKNSGERPVRKNEFGTRMKEKGYEDDRDTTGSTRIWLGIELIPEPQHPTLTVGGTTEDVSDTPDTGFGIASKEYSSSRTTPKSVSEASDVSENVFNTSTVEATTEREKENVLMMCLVLMSRYPNEVAKGGMLERAKTDAEYWVYRLEDAGLGSYSEAIVASTLETLRTRGEL